MSPTMPIFSPLSVLKNYYLLKKMCLLQASKDNSCTTQPYLQEGNHNQDSGEHYWHYKSLMLYSVKTSDAFYEPDVLPS